MRRTIALLLLSGLIVFAPTAAYAARSSTSGGGGKGGGGKTTGSSSFSLVLLNSTDGLPHWGQSVTFDIQTTQTDKPYVDLTCSQGGSAVYRNSAGYFSGYPWPWNQTMTLQSQAWTGGAADCSARLYSATNSGATTTLATMAFHVYA